jgi:hypothetical protein
LAAAPGKKPCQFLSVLKLLKSDSLREGWFMKNHLTILLSLLVLSGFVYSSDGGTNVLSNTNSEISQEAEPYDLWRGRRILSTEQQEQEVYQAKIVEIQSKIDLLRSEVASKSAEAKSAHKAIEESLSQYKSDKSILKDPWREIYGEKRFVMSTGSKFVKFRGQILEVASTGIRVFGQIGDSTKTEYFVFNFPYDFKAGESVDPAKIYVALEDGEFSYVSEDGYAKTLPKLNYGKPCAKPKNSDSIEQLAQQSQVNAAEQKAKVKDNIATATQQRMQDAIDEIAAVRKEAAEKLRLASSEALKYDLTFANKGNLDALRRMWERYRDGDGVEADTNKAAEYNRKYEDTFQTAAERIAEKNRLAELEAARQKFLNNLILADKFDNVRSALFVEECYRHGIGTSKDLIKADEYHAKAASLGIPRISNGSPVY